MLSMRSERNSILKTDSFTISEPKKLVNRESLGPHVRNDSLLSERYLKSGRTTMRDQNEELCESEVSIRIAIPGEVLQEK